MIMKKCLISLVSLIFCSVVLSAPREIIIIRHADKWPQKNPGPFLSPTGQLRAERFVFYYLAHFPKPDFIFATRPYNFSNPHDGYSSRPLQTVMPLANTLAYQNPNGYPIQSPYTEKDYAKLTHQLLTNSIYQNKIILICWHHQRINLMSRELGVTSPLKKWMSDDYDMVYDLKYNKQGKLISFQILKNQYPVHQNPTWKELSQCKT